MSTLRLATASNVRAFQNLTNALSASNRKWENLIDGEALEDEIGRFRVWAGNLGALQKGHSSLDYRLRDSPVSNTNTLKLLKELETNITEAYAVVSGARLPYEEQATADAAKDEDSDDGFFSEEESDEDSSSDEPRSELKFRFREIVDIIDNLYKLSVRIRTPGVRSRSLRASSYTQKDPDTGVDIFEMYATQDLKHTQELLSHLRQPYAGDAQVEQDFLATRLGASITLRRRHFKYWKRHRDKLHAPTTADDVEEVDAVTHLEAPAVVPSADPETHPMAPVKSAPREAPSQKTGRTLLSGTEVTQLHQSLDDIVDTKSVTSYAVTVKDIHGKGVDLPPPPKTANNDKDFECPYCWIVCPARYGKGRAWRTHLLQDLQPYVCTYPDCESPELLFRSRREWAEHEASHRRIWRCPEHPNAVFSSQSRLENHLRQTHFDNFPESQLETIAKVGEATTADTRVKCPICCAPADAEDLGGLQNHIANHLERIATFALPHSREDDLDGDSGIASRGSTMSQSLTGSLPAGSVHGNDKQEENDQPALEPAQSDSGRVSDFHHYKSELETMLEHLDNPNNPYHEDTAHLAGKPPTIGLDDVPTLRLLYRSQRLLQTDQSYVPNDSYNRMISICYYDITRLKVDAIVNNAPADLKVAPLPGTLHHAVMEAGGSSLLQETMSKVKIYPGKVDLTLGHDLPSDWVIHAAGPTYIGSKGVSQFIVLGDCYHSALRTAANLGIKTIAFPCLASGGGGFPARVAARIALQAVRENLDAHPEARFERIVFCVKSALDEKAYMDFFPVFFPPTYGDLDMARKSNQSGNRAKLASQVLDARAHMQKANKELSNKFAPFVSELEMDALYEIESALSSIRLYLLGPKELEKPLEDLSLFCSVLVTLCGSIIKMSERAKATEPTEEIRQEIWNETSRNMHTIHGFDLGRFLSYCWYFAKSLDEVLTQDKPEWDMTDVRPALESYRDKEKTQDIETTHDLPDEAMKIQHSMTSASNSRNSVQLHEIRSVATLYQTGEIKPKRTMAQPSATFNQTVCYVREDITRLAVDVIVNPTDTSFLGMGTLDRLVFKKGGPELQEEVKKFGVCEKGDIKTTPGYLLPAKQIIHVIPPQVFNSDTKNALRNMYRGILHTATFIGAKSVAIPSIGTGTLNYPRRDCGSLAMEEVRRFLQSREDGGLEKIVFVVYSHTDESTYKSLLPTYFPPTEQEVSKQPEAEGLDTSKTFVSDLVANALSRSSSANDQPLEMSKRAIPELDPVSTEIDESSSTDDESGILPPIQANVSIVRDSKATGVWGPISESSCIVQVMDRRVSVYEKVESSDEIPLGSHPIMSLNVLPGSGWSRTGLDRVILSKVRRVSAPLDDRVSVLFQFYNPSDADDLSYILEQVILGIAIDEERARSNEESDDDHGKGDFSLRSDARGNMYRSFGRQDKEEGNTGSSSVAGRKEDTTSPIAPPNVWSALSKKQGKMKEGSAQSNSKERSTAELASGFAALMGQAMHQDQENSMSSIAAADISSGYSKKDGKMEEESGQNAAGGSSTAQHPSADTSQSLEPNTESSPTLQSQPQYQLPEEDNTAHLLVQILEHLLIDLNIRPKSYIGTSTFEIASALNTDIATITSLLWELEEQGKVHTTIDSDTWVISGEPGEIPVLGSAEMHSR